MKYTFIQEHEQVHNVQLMARYLGVSRSGYYAWRSRQRCERARHQEQRDALVRDIFEQKKQRYGAPRISVELRRLGKPCNVKTVAQSLQRQGLRAKAARKYIATTYSKHSLPTYENILQQDFHATKMNQKWVADITYCPTEEGWVYLATVMDLYSRKIVGWAMAGHMRSQLVCEALQNALASRGYPRGVIVHSDRGSQYCSHDYRAMIEQYQLVGSMSATGCCYDNAAMESFFHSLKVELLHGLKIKTRQALKHEVFVYIETEYNRQRLHSACGYQSPDDFEQLAA